MKKDKLIKFFIAILLLFISFSKVAFAFEDIAEEFNSDFSEPNRWIITNTDGVISFVENPGFIALRGPGFSFPYIRTADLITLGQGFKIEIAFQYLPSTFDFGAGIAVSNATLDDQGQIISEKTVFGIWQDNGPDKLRVSTNVCPNYNPGCTNPISFFKTTSTDTNYHIVKYHYSDSVYKVFVDDTLEFTSAPTTFKPNSVWFGNSVTVNQSSKWTNVKIDYIRISSLEKKPVVLLPGFGGSWNLEAINTGTTVGPWKPTPLAFDKVYHNFRNTFLNADFEEGKNYFEFFYNWMQPIEYTADDFKNYLETTVFPEIGDSKIRLVGHSMGGLVARTYLQKYPSQAQEKIEKLVTVGSSHKGALKSYKAWEATKFENSVSLGRFAFEYLLFRNQSSFRTRLEALRTLIPSIREFLPIFDYLKKEADFVKQPSNPWLENLNNTLTQEIKNLMINVVGLEDHPTKDSALYYQTGEPNQAEKNLGFWQHGKVISEETTTQGDLTVLAKSASISGVLKTSIVNKDHLELMIEKEGIETILENLEEDIIPYEGASSSTTDPLLGFFLHSPATMRIISPEGAVGEGVETPLPGSVYSPEDNLILIPNASANTYEIELKGTGDGGFALDIMQETEEEVFWQTVEGEIQQDEQQVYQIEFLPDDPKETPLLDPDGEIYLEIAKKKIENLQDYLEKQEISFSDKRKINSHLKKMLRLIDKAVTYKNQEKFHKASRHLKAALVSLHRTRLLVNKYSKKDKISSAISVYLKNKLEETETLLINTYVLFHDKSNRSFSDSKVEKYRKSAQRILQKLESKVANQEITDNLLLGQALSLAQENLNKAQTSENNTEIHIYSFISRLYTLEGFRLL